MDPNELMQQARDALTVKRVFGEPYEKDGVTVIPAAAIRGGADGGRGEGGTPDGKGSGSGSGGGFGLTAKPAGVYVIDGTKVHWQPTVDANRVILGGQIVAVVLLLVVGRVLRARRSSSRAIRVQQTSGPRRGDYRRRRTTTAATCGCPPSR